MVSQVRVEVGTRVMARITGKLLAKNSERHLKSPQAMARLFADLPEAIANTKELSERLQFSLTDLGYEFPRYPVPEGETMASFLRKRTQEGARVRYLDPAKRHNEQRGDGRHRARGHEGHARIAVVEG